MRKLSLIIISFFTFHSFSQQVKIDSLKSLLKENVNNIEKIKVLKTLNLILIEQSSLYDALPYFLEMKNTSRGLRLPKVESRANKYISEYYIKEEDSVKAIKFASKALRINDSINNLKGYLIDINQLGRVYYHFQYYKKSVEIYTIGIDKYEKEGEKKPIKSLAIIYSNLSHSYDKLGKKEQSINAALKGVELAEKNDDTISKCYSNYIIGYKYMDLGLYSKAEKYFLKSLSYSDNLSQLIYKYMNHHGLGINYSNWGKFTKALYHNEIALEYFRESKNRLYEFDVLNNIAVVYNRIGKYEGVLKYGKNALNVAVSINNQLAINGAKETIAEAYINLKKFDKAEKYLLEIAKDTSNSKLMIDESKIAFFERMSIISSAKKEHKKSLKYYKRFKQLNDSLLLEKRDSKFADIETKYETEKKEKENLQLKADKIEQELLLVKESKRKWYFAFGLLIALLSLGVFWFYYQRNKKQKLVIENLQKDLHHRVKNNLAIIDSLIEDIKEEFNNDSFKIKLTDLQNRIDSINEVHSQLYMNTDITNLKLKQYVEKLSKNVQQSFSKENISIKQNINDSLILNVDKSFPVGLIINEFLTNSFKYAFDKESRGVVSISIIDKSQTYLLSLTDNGKGLPKDFDISKLDSFGMDVMKLLSKQLKGTFSLDGTNGVHLNIEFPKV
ncbi:MAG: sensor histidine kinase [Flavobacteriaceae bacterium]